MTYLGWGFVDLSGIGCGLVCLVTAFCSASASCTSLAMFGDECDRVRPPPRLFEGAVSVFNGALYDCADVFAARAMIHTSHNCIVNIRQRMLRLLTAKQTYLLIHNSQLDTLIKIIHIHSVSIINNYTCITRMFTRTCIKKCGYNIFKTCSRQIHS